MSRNACVPLWQASTRQPCAARVSRTASLTTLLSSAKRIVT